MLLGFESLGERWGLFLIVVCELNSGLHCRDTGVLDGSERGS